MLRLVVGLGNPGARYQRTRHNVGYRVIERLQSQGGVKAKLFKPESVFMNESGGPVQELARKNGITAGEILVVCDDFSIPMGQLRIRLKGSSGGHNGLNSIIERFGTPDVPRLRVGIGPVPVQVDPAHFVLESFSKSEDAAVEEAIGRAVEAVELAVAQGLEAAMNRFNQKEGGELVKVNEVMRKAAISIPQNAPLREVFDQFTLHQLEILPVVDAAQHVVGIIRPGDLLDFIFPNFNDVLRDYAAIEDKGQLSILFDAAFSGHDIANDRLILAADVMRASWVWVSYEESLLSAASRLYGQGVPQLPVVDRDRRLMGLISQTEIVLALVRGASKKPKKVSIA